MFARHKLMRFGPLLVVLLLMILLSAHPALSQVGQDALQACRSGGFSTEEDFVSRAPEPPDGNPIISDGDLLSADGTVCARNADLLSVFEPKADLGLDAVDVINTEKYLVVFSTELDDPNGQFTAGDLLATNGLVIANVALTNAFDVGYDIGLDAVHLIGQASDIEAFLDEFKGVSRSFWVENPGALAGDLRQFRIDIWFSTEGTPPPVDQPPFLDGDLLSVLGTIVLSNDLLLPSTVPAGIPNRGVDFGLDGFTSRSRNVETARQRGFFSTEILFDDPDAALNFSDGDVLNVGDGIASLNWDLIAAFEPRARDLGLDALSIGAGGPTVCENQITDVGGLQVDVGDINAGGRAEIGYPTDHPFGSDVPLWGTICDDVNQFRVVFRKAADGPGTGTGIPVQVGEGWMVKDRNPWTLACTVDVPWFSDAAGWFDGPTYRDLLFCNPNLILTDWKSGGAPDPNELYRVWLEFDRGAGAETEPSSHLVRLDNEAPKINNLGIPGGACTTYSASDMPIMVQGDFEDGHFWRYRLSIGGDLYPDHYYSWVNYYDATPEATNVNSGGTTPAATLVNLHEVDVFDLAASPVACAYGARLWVRDRTIVGSFTPAFNLVGGSFRSPVSQAIFFDYAP